MIRGTYRTAFGSMAIRALAVGALTLGAGAPPAEASDPPVRVALKLDGGGIHVPRPSYTQVFAADVTGGVISNARSPEKIDRDEWAYVVRPGLDITFDSPDPALGRRWTIAVRGGVMNYDHLRKNQVTPPGEFLAGGRVITPRITGGTRDTTAGSGAEAYTFDTRTQYRGALSYYDAGARLETSFSDGPVALRPSIGFALWSFDMDESIVNTALGASPASSNTLKLDTKSWNVGPVIGMAVGVRVHAAITIGLETFVSPYHADMDVRGRQTFTGGGQGGTPPVTVSDSRDLWGVRGGGKLSVAVDFSDQVTFSLAGEVDALSHVPYADVPDNPSSGPLKVKSDGSVLAGFTAGLRIRF